MVHTVCHVGGQKENEKETSSSLNEERVALSLYGLQLACVHPHVVSQLGMQEVYCTRTFANHTPT